MVLAWVILVLMPVLAYLAVVFIKALLKEWLCDHSDYFENGSCQAICSKCRKDLGFIGTVKGSSND